MLQFANVGGKKALPTPKGRGTCPCCGGLLVAKCGKIKVHHWAHQSKDDCDNWSEPMGPWHLWWQRLVQPEAAEVTRAPHRADIVGNDGVVVELQHSPISAEDIEAREAFYGDMVWLFDATERFASVNQGTRSFCSLGKTKHLELCKKPVFLDFGFELLEVESFTDAIARVSGYGIPRSREWFVERFLSDVLSPAAPVSEVILPTNRTNRPWEGKSPLCKLEFDTNWIDPWTGSVVTFRKWTEYIKLTWYRYTVGDSQNKQFNYDEVIARHPEIANGWTQQSLREMMGLFAGTPIILGGLLRILPFRAASIPVERTVRSMQALLSLAEAHIAAGRLPILKDTTKSLLLEKAKQFEMRTSGRISSPVKLPSPTVTPSLFD